MGVALREALRVLRSGGQFLCLEFLKVTAETLVAAYDVYSFHGIGQRRHTVPVPREEHQGVLHA